MFFLIFVINILLFIHNQYLYLSVANILYKLKHSLLFLFDRLSRYTKIAKDKDAFAKQVYHRRRIIHNPSPEINFTLESTGTIFARVRSSVRRISSLSFRSSLMEFQQNHFDITKKRISHIN